MKVLCSFMLAVTGFASAQQSVSTERWTFTFDAFGTPVTWPLTTQWHDGQVGGALGGDKLRGTYQDGKLHFHAADPQGGYEDVTASITGDHMSGTMVWAQNASVTHPTSHTFSATRQASIAAVSGPPQTHEFTPTVFRRQFSPLYEPVLTIKPGDTIHTWTVDAGGYDQTGTPRSLGGNPQTGPFFIEGANPGDILAVHIRKLALNRAWAISTNSIVDRANPPGVAAKLGSKGEQVRWHLDLAHGMAMPEKPGPHMERYAVPVRPMLGCIAVATNAGVPAPRTGDSGNFGGNMDFNELTEGSTVYLPVNVPGALLYLGDGHAVQGDGETTGDALETSMDVTVNVEIVHDQPVRGPFVETTTHIMSLGLDGSIDTAFQDATERMQNYLERKYSLTPQEFAMVLGTAAEYKVSEAADRNAGVVLKMAKSTLATLTSRPERPSQPKLPPTP